MTNKGQKTIISRKLERDFQKLPHETQNFINQFSNFLIRELLYEIAKERDQIYNEKLEKFLKTKKEVLHKKLADFSSQELKKIQRLIFYFALKKYTERTLSEFKDLSCINCDMKVDEPYCFFMQNQNKDLIAKEQLTEIAKNCLYYQPKNIYYNLFLAKLEKAGQGWIDPKLIATAYILLYKAHVQFVTDYFHSHFFEKGKIVKH